MTEERRGGRSGSRADGKSAGLPPAPAVWLYPPGSWDGWPGFPGRPRILEATVSFLIPALIWSIYCLAKRNTAGILTNTDLIVCGTVVSGCVIATVCELLVRRQENKNCS